MHPSEKIEKVESVIKVESLSKRFKIYANPWHRPLEWIGLNQKHYHDDFWALKDISFEVKQEKCLGIIGKNGAGKSTLLKILTGALYPTSGTYTIKGKRVLSLLELGTGFNPELTGKENLFNSAAILNFPANYLKERLADIEEFAELGDYWERPIKLYSSGMYVRLAFSLFVFLEPEVLIIDEALSVGDIFFQQKSFAKIRQMLSSGTTCLFVSHDLNAVLNLCHDAILLDKGKLALWGDPQEVVTSYLTLVGRRQSGKAAPSLLPTGERKEKTFSVQDIIENNLLNKHHKRWGAGGLQIEALRVTNKEGIDTLSVEMEEALSLHMLVVARDHIIAPSVGIELFDRIGNRVFSAGTRQLGIALPDLYLGEKIVVRFDVTFNVVPGQYTFGVGTSEPSQEGPNIGFAHDRIELLGPIAVNFDFNKLMPFYGLAKLPMTAEFQKVLV